MGVRWEFGRTGMGEVSELCKERIFTIKRGWGGGGGRVVRKGMDEVGKCDRVEWEISDSGKLV